MARESIKLNRESEKLVQQARAEIAASETGYKGVWPKEVMRLEAYPALATEWARRIIGMTKPVTIMDAGCGSGSGSLALLAHIVQSRQDKGMQTQVYLADVSWEAMVRLGQALASLGIDYKTSPNFHIRNWNVETYKNSSLGEALELDGLFMRNSIHWLNDPIQFLRNLCVRSSQAKAFSLMPGAFVYVDTITHFNPVVLLQRSAENQDAYERSREGDFLLKYGIDVYVSKKWGGIEQARKYKKTPSGSQSTGVVPYTVHSFSEDDLSYTFVRNGCVVEEIQTYFNTDYVGMPPELFPAMERQPENVRVMARRRTQEEEMAYTKERFAGFNYDRTITE